MFFKKKPVKPFTDDQVGVLFVCMGNICRSPAAEGIFKHYVRQQQREELFFIDSAGTTGYHKGASADPRMIEAANKRGYTLDSHSRKVMEYDLEYFHLIVAMDFENRINLRAMSNDELPHVRLLGSFLPDAVDDENARSVPDPYYGNQQGFEIVLDMIEQACPLMYQHCLTLSPTEQS